MSRADRIFIDMCKDILENGVLQYGTTRNNDCTEGETT